MKYFANTSNKWAHMHGDMGKNITAIAFGS